MLNFTFFSMVLCKHIYNGGDIKNWNKLKVIYIKHSSGIDIINIPKQNKKWNYTNIIVSAEVSLGHSLAYKIL